MKRHLLTGASAVLLAIAAQTAAAAEAFPTSDVFRPLIADPVEPRFFISFLRLERSNLDTTSVAAVGAGINYGLARWHGEKEGEGWQIGIFGSIFSQFDLGSSGDDLLNSDYRAGVPLSYKRGDFSARGRLFHQSSHLGDEAILSGAAPRIDFSFEAVDLLLGWQMGNWRPYGGGTYILRSSLDDVKKTGLQAGLDYVGTSQVLFGGRLVGGLDVKSFDETDWSAAISLKVGLEFGRPRPERRGITVLLIAYDGPSPAGQFFRDNISYQGVSFQFEL